MNRRTTIAIVLSLAFVLVLALAAVTIGQMQQMPDQKKEAMTGQVVRGEYLVNFGGCNDCHSPKVMVSGMPMPDTTLLLSGHQANQAIPEVPSDIFGPGKWGALTSNDFTAWAGPWGVSFAFNLTPDKVTGTGSWTEDIFVKTMRTGKHMGAGRDILPPMPWPSLAQLTDDDLGAIFSYLQSLPPVSNQVPQPIPPGQQGMPDHKK